MNAVDVSRSQRKRLTWLLIVILGIALGLRVWGIAFGLPYDLTFDEVHEIVRAFKLGAGEYYWDSFGKGGLYYLLFLEYGFLFVAWWMMGWVTSPSDFALLYFRDPSIFYLAGRLTVALLGSLTCLVIFAIGKRLYGWRVGLGAAIIGATAYYHGLHSHVINVDTGMTLALWSSIWAYLRYEETQDRRWLVATGILAGLGIAFKLPGAIVFLPLFLGIGSRFKVWYHSGRLFKEAGAILLFAVLIWTVITPEWTVNLDTLARTPSLLVGGKAVIAESDESDLRSAVHSVTIYRGREWTGYFKILVNDYNLALTVTAVLGAVLGLFRRQRWDIIWGAFVIAFLLIMTPAQRTQPERYLLPIAPALWLLSSQFIARVSGRKLWLNGAGLACVIVLPLLALVKQDVEWTRPDTRVVAKQWIEANVPSGSKILMDGMRYRFVPSPPLNPDKSMVRERAERAARDRLSRGVSHRALSLYEEAMQKLDGPTYELHSTVWGLEVEDVCYYIQSGFDYIVTSSVITSRYQSKVNQERFPKSAKFYQQLPFDPRLKKLYSVEPAPWKRSGPVITLYKVMPSHDSSVVQKSASDDLVEKLLTP